MKTKDLGTYHVRVIFENSDGFIHQWTTGCRYTDGAYSCHPLNATRITPTWDSEEDLESAILYMFTEGNYSCDCNKQDFLDRAHQTERPDDYDSSCGDTLEIKELWMIRPDFTEKQLIGTPRIPILA